MRTLNFGEDNGLRQTRLDQLEEHDPDVLVDMLGVTSLMLIEKFPIHVERYLTREYGDE